MKGVVFMARDAKQPVTFDLTDNDQVALVPWEFIVDKFDTILSGVISNLGSIERDLGRIETKIDEWISEQ